jgi:hypothetical protein
LRSVAEVIRERLAPLPADCREALEVASVLGRDFEYPPLAAALRVSPARAVAALDPAVKARLVSPEEGRAGAYRFVHTLIRDAVEEQLAPSRRARLHARVFTALRDIGWGQPADLAHHAVQARPNVSDEVAAAAAHSAAHSAAEAADELLAWEDAAAWWQVAIGLARRDHQDASLQMRLGRSLLLAGRDPGAAAGQRARLAARWAIATYWQPGGQDQSRQASRAAVELAEQAGDTEALGAALIARQFTLRGPDFLEERLAAGVAVLDIATRLGDEDLRFRA